MTRCLAMIPARMGSERIKHKNLRLLGGKPLVAYAIKAAQESQIFEKIMINSEEPLFQKMGERYGAEFYQRPSEFAQSSTKSDEVVYDFLIKNPCDYIFWVNPTSPFQKAHDLQRGLKLLEAEKAQSLFTVCPQKVHAYYEGRPLNFSTNELFPRTQDLEPVDLFAFTYMAWQRDSFIKAFETKGHGFLHGKVVTLRVDQISAIDIDEEEDFQMASTLLDSQNTEAQYDPLFEEWRSSHEA